MNVWNILYYMWKNNLFYIHFCKKKNNCFLHNYQYMNLYMKYNHCNISLNNWNNHLKSLNLL